MNAEQLLEIIGEAREGYVLAAINTRSGVQPRRLSLHRRILIAAIVALMLLLVGCVAVFLGLQDMKIGETTSTRRFDEYGKLIEPTEVSEDVISLHGFGGSPLQLATREWYEFAQSYDPDETLLYESFEKEPDLPEDYRYIYGCYTQEMADKVDEIAEKYDLKLLSRMTVVQRWQCPIFFEAVGIDGLCFSDAQAEVKYLSGYFYQNGNFQYTVDFTLTGEDSAWPYEIWSNVYYARKDYFDPDYTSVETEDYDQWTYTTSRGTEVLLARRASGAMIFAQQEDAVITVTLNTNTAWMFPEDESQIPGREVIEQAAEIFDFSIRPQAVADMDAVEAKLEQAQEDYDAQNRAPVNTYASYSEYLKTQLWIEDLYYCLLDLNGDGVEELLLGEGPDSFGEVRTMTEDMVSEELFTGADYRLCEDGYIEGCDSVESWDQVSYYYYRLENNELVLVDSVTCRAGSWLENEDEPITQTEADAIRSRYVPVELDMKPALDYPVDGEGTTLREVLGEEVPPTEEEMLALYGRFAADTRSIYKRNYYTLADINGDGVKELLLSPSEEYFSEVVTIKRGTARMIYSGSSYLCEDNVIEFLNVYMNGTDGEHEDHSYGRLEGKTWVYLTYVRHSKSADTWGLKANGPELTEDEAAAVMAQFPRVELDMKPISELFAEAGLS